MISITIDGEGIQVPEGTTVLRAAQMAGIYIPVLCDHPQLSPYGGCRMCLVEIEGLRGLQPSCTMPAGNNMIVHTNTEKIQSARKFVLSLIFSERNHFCPFCQVSGGDCELQNAALKEGMTHWPISPNFKPFSVDASHPNFILDHNRCILCRRCVRSCSEQVGNFTLGFEERGANSFLVADLGVPLGESTCISCGNCVQVCPTGALIDRASAYRGLIEQVEHSQSICVGCSVGCGIEVHHRDNAILKIQGMDSSPVNNGMLCKIGRFEPLNEERQRLVTPLVRKEGQLKAATWAEALTLVSNRLKSLVGRKNGVAAMSSTRQSVESLYAFKQLFSDKLGNEMVTSIEEGQTTAISSSLADELGKPFEGQIETIKKSDCVLIIGANLVSNHQVTGFFVKRNLPRGTKLIVIDPFDNSLDSLANVCMKFKKGSDQDIIQGILTAMCTAGLVQCEAKDIPETMDEIVRRTGLSLDLFTGAGKLLAQAKNPVIIYGKGVSGKVSKQELKQLVNFARLTGVMTSEHSGLISIKGQANSMAAAQYHLDKPFKLNGQEMIYLSLGDDVPSKRWISYMDQHPFIVVQASYTSQITALADVVLPVEMWAEITGTFVNLEGRVQKTDRVLQPPEDVWSSERVLKAVAAKLGFDLNEQWKQALLARVSPVSLLE